MRRLASISTLIWREEEAVLLHGFRIKRTWVGLFGGNRLGLGCINLLRGITSFAEDSHCRYLPRPEIQCCDCQSRL